jgi:8-oxo-dGTP pyrophosphatase MutT (NUDIX family)
MPTPLIKSFAKKSHKSTRRVEKYWDEAKKSAAAAGFKTEDPAFWAYTNAIVQRRAGLRRGKRKTFKEYLSIDEGVDDELHGKELEKTGFYGKAGAGCLILAKSTGRLCMPHRSRMVEQPGTWGTWGGAIDSGEDPKEAAIREVREEAEYDGPLKMIPLLVFKHPSGFRYFNFLAVVEEEFEPVLDWETQGFKWCELNDLPEPLHFGVISVLNDGPSMEILKKFSTQKD